MLNRRRKASTWFVTDNVPTGMYTFYDLSYDSDVKHQISDTQTSYSSLHTYFTQLSKMSFDEIFDITAGVYFSFFIIIVVVAGRISRFSTALPIWTRNTWSLTVKKNRSCKRVNSSSTKRRSPVHPSACGQKRSCTILVGRWVPEMEPAVRGRQPPAPERTRSKY